MLERTESDSRTHFQNNPIVPGGGCVCVGFQGGHCSETDRASVFLCMCQGLFWLRSLHAAKPLWKESFAAEK